MIVTLSEAFHLVQDVAGEQDRPPFRCEFGDELRRTASISGSSPDVETSSRKSSASEANAATSAIFCRLPFR
jgi:hypothetical protein